MLMVVSESNGDFYYEKMMNNKRVILICASQSALKNTREFIESHDLVVRVNYQWPIQKELQDRLGERVDIIYHNSAGRRNIHETLVEGPRFIWYDRNRNMFNIKRYLQKNNVHGSLIRPFRDKVVQEIGTHPNMGMLALMHLLKQPLQSLHLTGLTFFREPYYSGYPESRFGNDKEIFTRTTDGHDADIQFNYFCKNIVNHPKLTIDPTLKEIVCTNS